MKESYLSVSGYVPDADDQDSITGNGFTGRKALFSGGKTAQLLTKIDSDLFNQDLFLISNCEVELEVCFVEFLRKPCNLDPPSHERLPTNGRR